MSERPTTPHHPSTTSTSTAPGRDETLLRYLRGLSVDERMALNDAAVRAALELRGAADARRRRG